MFTPCDAASVALDAPEMVIVPDPLVTTPLATPRKMPFDAWVPEAVPCKLKLPPPAAAVIKPVPLILIP